MELGCAVQTIASTDRQELPDRAGRLQELSNLLGDENITLVGQAAEWLFEDVKATWIYGYFVSTLVTRHAFCLQQLTGLVRLVSDNPGIGADMTDLEELAQQAEALGVVDLDMRARLVGLHDSAAPYLAANSSTVTRRLERRIDDASRFSNDHALPIDARSAVGCCIRLL